MQIMTGTKRENTIMEWREQIEKHMKRANDSMECFRLFADTSDLEHLIESCEKVLEYAKGAKKAIDHMNYLGIK